MWLSTLRLLHGKVVGLGTEMFERFVSTLHKGEVSSGRHDLFLAYALRCSILYPTSM